MGHTQKTTVPQVQKILAAATQVFVHDGYLKARIQRIANEATVSTRTIYEHFGNKADLFGAVIEQHVDRYVAMVVLPDKLEQLEIREALTSIAELLRRRACGYDAVVLFRLVASEATRFPDLAKTMRCRVKRRLENTVADYFRTQVDRGHLVLSDPSRAALVFLQMVLVLLSHV
jgi:TetR/AcrR family transcriptional repressor of mexJK operon